MGILGREVILGMGRPREIVKVPEWGGEVIVATLSLPERMEWERWQAAQPTDADTDIPGYLAFALIDEQGKRVFTPEDVAELQHKSAAVLMRLYRVARRLNSIDAEVAVAQGESAPSR
jgi:hypothetical protein